MNGDSIADFGRDLNSIGYVFGQIYLFLFVTLSILVLLNVFIILIEDGYIAAKYVPKNDLLDTNKDVLGKTEDLKQLSHKQALKVMKSQKSKDLLLKMLYGEKEQLGKKEQEESFEDVEERNHVDE
jgi:hypothetical protein